MMAKVERKINRDDYFVIYVTMPTGFECKVPARGYNLKSWLAFETKLNNTYYYEHTTEEVYRHLVFGDPNDRSTISAHPVGHIDRQGRWGVIHTSE